MSCYVLANCAKQITVCNTEIFNIGRFPNNILLHMMLTTLSLSAVDLYHHGSVIIVNNINYLKYTIKAFTQLFEK